MGDFLTGQSGVSRRGLLKGASVMGAAILLAPMSANRAAAQPKKGGILRIGFNSGSNATSVSAAFHAAVGDIAYLNLV